MADQVAEPRKEVKISIGKANLWSLALVLPVFLSFGIPYLILWMPTTDLAIYELLKEVFLLPIKKSPYLTLFLIGGGILMHELIHGLSWALFTENHLKDIKFGMAWAMLTPYCHCKVPISVKNYLIGLLAPGLLLGLVPALYGLLNQEVLIMLLGSFFILVGGGDYLVAWYLRKEKITDLVKDHPAAVGYIIYPKADDRLTKASIYKDEPAQDA